MNKPPNIRPLLEKNLYDILIEEGMESSHATDVAKELMDFAEQEGKRLRKERNG